MKAKRFLSLLLSLVTVLGLIAMPVYADGGNDITAYVNFSEYGEIANDKNGNALVLAPVTLTGKEDGYTLDDVFRVFHDTYYEGGSNAGYKTETGTYGSYVTKLWGDESGLFGYQINAGDVYVMGPGQAVNDKDVIDAVIYKSAWPDTENYAFFDCYEKEADADSEFALTLKNTYYDASYNTNTEECAGAKITVDGKATEYETDDDGKVKLKFDKAGTYVISAEKKKTLSEGGETVPAITAPVCVVTVKNPYVTLSAPSDATVFVGEKGTAHYVPFTEKESAKTSEADGVKTYYYKLENKKEYNYRISKEGCVTVGGVFTAKENLELNITDAELNPEGKNSKTVDRDVKSNSGFNVGDIYLNINAAGWLKLNSADTYQIVNFRNWEPVNNTTKNYFLEPDFHYEATDINGDATDAIEVDKNGLITAKKSGTAIVKVTYDAVNLDFGKGFDFYGAIWPENTGVFVVTVDAEETVDAAMKINEGKNSKESKLSGDGIDSEHDVIYFFGDAGKYEFAPEYDASVFVANPTVGTKVSYSGFSEVSKKEDKSFSIPLTEGRNIVKITAEGKDMYQVITAKKVSVTVNNGEEVNPGDKISVVFDTLYSPAGKLSAIYNYSASVVYSKVSGYEGKTAGSLSASHKFASESKSQTVAYLVEKKEAWGSVSYAKTAELSVPDDFDGDTFTLSGGSIFVSGWGEPIGTHRAVSYETGKEPMKNAPGIAAELSRLPDIEIPITKLPPISGITLDSDKVKKEYYAGDKFDTKGLTVTANYEGDINKVTENYTVSPEVLTEDTTKVTVTYKGKTAEIPVTVTVAKVKSIEITAAPSKTDYTEGETFNPSGMVITAVYENKAKKATSEYTYSPLRELSVTDKSIEISYTGEDKTESIAAVSLPITVKADEGTSSSGNKISVYFTLLGDKNHGEPEGKDDTHTKKKNNLETWIPKTKITLDKGSCVLDAIEKALSLNGIPYTNEDDYISEVKGLAEKDNGELSGWMYTLNSKYPSKSVSAQKLYSGDVLVFHYTDDYTAENTGYSGSSGSSSSSKKDTDSKVTVNPGPVTKDENKSVFSENTYKDVKKDDWFYEYVKSAYESNLMKGTDLGFEPNAELTRAMAVAMLHRMQEEPEVDYAVLFGDVAKDAWYEKAVRWAASEKIVAGIEENVFGGDIAVTREQLAVMLFRYADKKNMLDSERADLTGFSDSDTVSKYAYEALSWAVKTGIMQGNDEGKLLPADKLTRAEAAAMFVRFFAKENK